MQTAHDLWTAWCRSCPANVPYWWFYHWQQWKLHAQWSRACTDAPWQHQLDALVTDAATVQLTLRITDVDTQQGFERIHTLPVPSTVLDLLTYPAEAVPQCLSWSTDVRARLRVDPTTWHLQRLLPDGHPDPTIPSCPVFAVLRALDCSPNEEQWMILLRHLEAPQDHDPLAMILAIEQSRHQVAEGHAWLAQATPSWFACADNVTARAWYLLYLIHVRHYQFPDEPRACLPAMHLRTDIESGLDAYWKQHQARMQLHLPVAALMDLQPSIAFRDLDPPGQSPTVLSDAAIRLFTYHGMLDPVTLELTTFARITHGVVDESAIRTWLQDHRCHWITRHSVQWPGCAVHWVVWNDRLVGWMCPEDALAAFHCAPKSTVRELGVIWTPFALYLRTDAGRCQRMVLGRGSTPTTPAPIVQNGQAGRGRAETVQEAGDTLVPRWLDTWEMQRHGQLGGDGIYGFLEPHPYSLVSWHTRQIPFLGHWSPLQWQCGDTTPSNRDYGATTALVMPEGVERTTWRGDMVILERRAELLPEECWVSMRMAAQWVRNESMELWLPAVPQRPLNMDAYPYLDPETGVVRVGVRLKPRMVVAIACPDMPLMVPSEVVGWRVTHVEGTRMLLTRARCLEPGDWLHTRHGVGWKVTRVSTAIEEADVWISAVEQLPPWSLFAEHFASERCPDRLVSAGWKFTHWNRKASFRTLKVFMQWCPARPDEGGVCVREYREEEEMVVVDVPRSWCDGGDEATGAMQTSEPRYRVCMTQRQWQQYCQMTAWGQDVRFAVQGPPRPQDPLWFPSIPGVVRAWLATQDDVQRFVNLATETSDSESEETEKAAVVPEPTTAPTQPGPEQMDEEVIYPPRHWLWTSLYMPDSVSEERRIEDTRQMVQHFPTLWETRVNGFWNRNSQQLVPWLDEEILETLRSERQQQTEWQTPWLLASEEPVHKRARVDDLPAPTLPAQMMVTHVSDATKPQEVIRQIGSMAQLASGEIVSVKDLTPCAQQPAVPATPIMTMPAAAQQPAVVMINTGKVTMDASNPSAMTATPNSRRGSEKKEPPALQVVLR